eukprot:TRINITY_DN104331_c0_g1_i1.p1 TRINITY_DN104331_c0_g1~~TRINITY_DN104331_c0_g1_i1.p1  ORF type:complete len:609 (+),score=80.29 TRINITY_DN104331_c0_g1_i1:47-1873(+)
MAFSSRCKEMREGADNAQCGTAAPRRLVKSKPSAAPAVVKSWKLPQGVGLDLHRNGDGKTFPHTEVLAHVVGRLPSGCVFESSQGKGQAAMQLLLGRNAIVPGMELGLKQLSLGSVADIFIPAHLGYGKTGVPRIVPPDSDLIFQVSLVEVDGLKSEEELTEPACQEEADEQDEASGSFILHQSWWLSRVVRPKPSGFYLNFCRYLADPKSCKLIATAREVPRRAFADLKQSDVMRAAGPFIVTGMQNGWKAKNDWDLNWFKKHLGDKRQLVKWLGPVFTQQECLWESPVWEASVSEYVNYVHSLETADPDCEEQNAEHCPRLYLNGWPAFAQIPWLRNYVSPSPEALALGGASSVGGCLEDLNALIIAESEALRESLLEGLTAKGGYRAPDKAEQRQRLETEDWELTKLFLSPKGSITRLHFDNGGAHAWLSQVRGRKMFVCFAPSDTSNLHPFTGDEGLANGTWLDPLDPEVLQRWPEAANAKPYVAVVEEGETIVAPQGWWHYAVSLDTSVTIMRNFYSSGNQQELIKRKDGGLAAAIGMHVLKKQAKLKNQPDAVINQIATKTVEKLRNTFIENRATNTGNASVAVSQPSSGSGYESSPAPAAS